MERFCPPSSQQSTYFGYSDLRVRTHGFIVGHVPRGNVTLIDMNDEIPGLTLRYMQLLFGFGHTKNGQTVGIVFQSWGTYPESLIVIIEVIQ